MPDHTSSQETPKQRGPVVSEDGRTIVRTAVLQQMREQRPARLVVKVGNQLEF